MKMISTGKFARKVCNLNLSYLVGLHTTARLLPGISGGNNRYWFLRWNFHGQCRTCKPFAKHFARAGYASAAASSVSQSTLSLENKSVKSYLESLAKEYEDMNEKFAKADHGEPAEVNNERYHNLHCIMQNLREVEKMKHDIAELHKLKENGDNEMAELARHDINECEKQLHDLQNVIFDQLVPKDVIDDSDIIVEVSAGVGGQEAMLFAADIFNMYTNYIRNRHWSIQFADMDYSEIGGLRHGSMGISGREAYRVMKYEGGVHRVQRVPKTEKSGRIHTSTITVAVLPQPTEISVVIKPDDIKIDTMRSSGPGGQSVNTTDSAVRITHLPTGFTIENQTERSQAQNKKIAMQRLRAKLYESQVEQQLSRQQITRKLQVGSSSRSEKIRTYNFLQDRITDHRIGLALYNLPEFINGSVQFQRMVEALQNFARKEYLLEIIECKGGTRN